jgi:catechol 2,3-dioxygenase-like lactoylglutathione lyase family enzyme
MGYHPVFSQLNLVVRDMDAAVAFYRRLGLPVTVHAGGYHAEATLPNGTGDRVGHDRVRPAVGHGLGRRHRRQHGAGLHPAGPPGRR